MDKKMDKEIKFNKNEMVLCFWAAPGYMRLMYAAYKKR